MTRSRLHHPALVALTLVFVVGACATNNPARERSRPGDRPAGMDGHAGMTTEHGTQAMMPRMMQLHERMAADTLIHQRMMADPEMRAAMAEMMGGAMDMEAMHARMAAMSPEERAEMRARMHEQRHERMMALPADERQARMDRMMEAHRRLMEDPAVRERMMADPEMRRMMQEVMHGDGTRGTDHDDLRPREHPDGHDD